VLWTAKRGVQVRYAPSAFVSTVTESLPIRTSHPSGSRPWGYPARGKGTRPWLLRSPRNSSVPCHGQVFRTSSVKPPASDGRFVSIASGWQLVRSGFTNRWVLRVGGSNLLLVPCQRRIGSNPLLHDHFGGIRRWPIKSRGCRPTCTTGSPPQPETYRFIQMPCSRQKGPGRAGCSSRPAPACEPPS
jgi:hypothetical protein